MAVFKQVLFLFLVDQTTSTLSFKNVYEILVQDLLYYWYDIFINLGFSRETLEAVQQKYPYDAAMCLYDMVKLWIAREDPPPRWKDLAWVLRYKILEGKVAEQIEKTYLPDPEKELKGECSNIQL